MKKAIRGQNRLNRVLNAPLTPLEEAELAQGQAKANTASLDRWVCRISACVRKNKHEGLCLCREWALAEPSIMYQFVYGEPIRSVGGHSYRRFKRI